MSRLVIDASIPCVVLLSTVVLFFIMRPGLMLTELKRQKKAPRQVEFVRKEDTSNDYQPNITRQS